MILQLLGAAGAGKSTLGRLLAQKTGLPLLHADFYRWQDDSFAQMRPVAVRRAMLAQDMACHPSFLLDGGVAGWLPPELLQPDLLILVRCPRQLRMDRLIRREQGRYGSDCLHPSHPHYRLTREFLDWAAGYETDGLTETNSLASHLALLSAAQCPGLILWNTKDPAGLAAPVLALLQGLCHGGC